MYTHEARNCEALAVRVNCLELATKTLSKLRRSIHMSEK